jgi:hypothetical protein
MVYLGGDRNAVRSSTVAAVWHFWPTRLPTFVPGGNRSDVPFALHRNGTSGR